MTAGELEQFLRNLNPDAKNYQVFFSVGPFQDHDIHSVTTASSEETVILRSQYEPEHATAHHLVLRRQYLIEELMEVKEKLRAAGVEIVGDGL